MDFFLFWNQEATPLCIFLEKAMFSLQDTGDPWRSVLFRFWVRHLIIKRSAKPDFAYQVTLSTCGLIAGNFGHRFPLHIPPRIGFHIGKGANYLMPLDVDD